MMYWKTFAVLKVFILIKALGVLSLDLGTDKNRTIEWLGLEGTFKGHLV